MRQSTKETMLAEIVFQQILIDHHIGNFTYKVTR